MNFENRILGFQQRGGNKMAQFYLIRAGPLI